jgi:hypothetical protein
MTTLVTLYGTPRSTDHHSEFVKAEDQRVDVLPSTARFGV